MKAHAQNAADTGNTPIVQPEAASWKQRLLDEYVELSNRLNKLEEAFGDPDFRLSHAEWTMLMEQRDAMRRYRFILEERCKYYDLIPKQEVVCCGHASDCH